MTKNSGFVHFFCLPFTSSFFSCNLIPRLFIVLFFFRSGRLPAGRQAGPRHRIAAAPGAFLNRTAPCSGLGPGQGCSRDDWYYFFSSASGNSRQKIEECSVKNCGLSEERSDEFPQFSK
jgi:hypothetical protein